MLFLCRLAAELQLSLHFSFNVANNKLRHVALLQR